MNGGLCLKTLEGRGLFMFARMDGRQLALDVLDVSLFITGYCPVA